MHLDRLGDPSGVLQSVHTKCVGSRDKTQSPSNKQGVQAYECPVTSENPSKELDVCGPPERNERAMDVWKWKNG